MTDSAHPQCAASRRAIQVLSARGERLVIVPQILYEFWAVATRKPGLPPTGGNGLGMTPARAGQWIQLFRRRFTLLPDQSALLDTWLARVKSLGIAGHRAHDVQLVAAMQTHGISDVLTFNAADFKGLPVTVIDPATV